jgi:hypothetical protein
MNRGKKWGGTGASRPTCPTSLETAGSWANGKVGRFEWGTLGEGAAPHFAGAPLAPRLRVGAPSLAAPLRCPTSVANAAPARAPFACEWPHVWGGEGGPPTLGGSRVAAAADPRASGGRISGGSR